MDCGIEMQTARRLEGKSERWLKVLAAVLEMENVIDDAPEIHTFKATREISII